MKIRQAFLYQVKTHAGHVTTFHVKVAKCVTYSSANVGWMDDINLPEWKDSDPSVPNSKGRGTLSPDVDICEKHYKFDTEDEALIFIANHYKSELSRKIHEESYSHKEL